MNREQEFEAMVQRFQEEDEPHKILDVPYDANDEQLLRAYFRCLRYFPLSQMPWEHNLIRHAYDALKKRGQGCE